MSRTRIFDHLDLRVASLARAKPFYDRFLPAVGFPNVSGEPEDGYLGYAAEDEPGGHPKPPFIGLNEDAPGHRGDASRVAFWADTPEEVDRIGAIVTAAGARVVEGPEYCYDYSPGYYAVFFEDEDGNKWEVCCRTAPVQPTPGDAA